MRLPYNFFLLILLSSFPFTFSFSQDIILNFQEVFDGLANLIFIGEDLKLRNNEVLTNCCGLQELLSTPGAFAGYSLFKNNPYGCNSIEEIIALECPFVVSVNNHSLTKRIVLYPNPTREKVYIEIPETLKVYEIILFNGQGKQAIKTTSLEIDMRTLNKGQYYLEIVTDEGVAFKKIILL